MSGGPRLARAAAQVLAGRVEPRRPTDAVRQRATSAIREALAERARSRRRRRVLFMATAVAAVIALGVGGTTWSMRGPVASVAPTPTTPAAAPAPAMHIEEAHGAVFVVRGGERAAVSNQSKVALGEHVVSTDGSATVALSSGTRLDLEPHGELAVTSDDAIELVHLSAGSVTAKVAKVGQGHRFVVRTQETDVEVRGTVFRVSRARDERCGFVTHVRVNEGLVVVRSPSGERALGPASEWTSPCNERPAPEPPPKPSLASTPRHGTPPSAELAPSELAAQNALFRSAMASKEHGDGKRAVADLDTLLARYPKTPLREAALAQRMKLLATFDRGAALAAARGYLAAYPTGFARAEAEALVSASPR